MISNMTPGIAELLGFLLGDGCRSRFLYHEERIDEVAFTGNAKEFGYYRDFIRKTILSDFHAGGYLGIRNDNTVRFHVRSRQLAKFLDELSIPVGKRRDAEIPEQIRSDKHLLRRFIRGFYHAEGSIYRRYSKKYKGHAKVYSNLLVIQFRNKLRTLMHQLHSALNRLGISTTRLSEAAGVLTFRITNQIEIARFLQLFRPVLKAAPRTL